MMIISIEDHIEIEDPLKEVGIPVRMEGHLIEEDTQIEGLLEEGTSIEMEDPLEEEDTQKEDLLMMEDPLEMEDLLVDKDHQALKNPLGW